MARPDMKIIRIAICDDELVYQQSMKEMCRSFFEQREAVEIHVFSSGKELTGTGVDYDIVLLDIEMPGQDGISIKDYFEADRRQTRIIFTTNHKERVLEAFGKNVVAFLVKPLCMEEFEKIMERICADLHGQILEIEEGGETVLIPVKQIKYIEAQDKYTLAVTESGERLLRKTMKYWESVLPCENFVRIHKSYLVNLEYFEKKGNEVRLEKGKTVKMSRLWKPMIMDKYKEFLRRKAKEI